MLVRVVLMHVVEMAVVKLVRMAIMPRRSAPVRRLARPSYAQHSVVEMIAHGTAPTIPPPDLNHALGTAAAPFSVDVRSADQISADDRVLSVGRNGSDTFKTLRRCGVHPLLQGREDHGADRGGRDRSAIYFATCPFAKAGAKPGHVRNKGEGK